MEEALYCYLNISENDSMMLRYKIQGEFRVAVNKLKPSIISITLLELSQHSEGFS